MIKVLKMFFKVIIKIMLCCFSIPIAIICLPFYGIYTLFCRDKKKSTPPEKGEPTKSHYVDRIEGFLAFFDD